MQANALSDRRIVGEERTTATGGQQLAPAETQDADLTPGSGDAAMTQRAGHLSRVLNHGQLVLIGECSHGGHLDNAAVQVRRDDGFCLRRPRGVQLSRVELSGQRIKINQDRLRSDRQHVFEIPLEVISGEDDLIAGTDPKSTQR